MVRRILAFRPRLSDLGIVALILEHAWRSFPEFIAVTIAILLLSTSVVATAAATHSKAVNTEDRVDNLVGAGALAANGRVSNLSGQNTSNNGLTDGTIGGHTDTAGLADGTIGGQTGGQIGGASAHVHGSGSLSVNNGHHEHGANASDGNLAVNNGQHHHTLPAV
jgi:hypothetical protein